MKFITDEDFKNVGMERKYPPKPGHVISLIDDRVFRVFIKNKRNRKFLAKIINIVTSIDYDFLLENMVLVDTNIIEDNIYNHYNDQDVIIYIDNLTINIELSSNKYYNEIKNEVTAFKYAGNQYKVGTKYEEKTYIFYQICIENYNIFNNNLLITESKIVDVSSGNYESETDRFKKFHINLKNIDSLCYNEGEKYFKFFTLTNISELEKLCEGDEILMNSLDDLKNLSTDSIFISELEKKEIDEYCKIYEMKQIKNDALTEGKAIGINEEKNKIAKKLLEQKIDIDIISKSTGLSIEEIKELNK